MIETEHLLGWLVYIATGIACGFIWWQLTSYIRHGGWRDLLRGVFVVVIFTPWYAGDAHEFLAPAVVVLLMDLLLEGATAGIKGGVALLFSSFAMLVVLTIRALLFKRRVQKAEDS
ncbi:MAG: hypothetical protein P8J55_14530 [Pseudomonadales bacterium]|nr:hypothetical protein [Pseudomonadales bacterium]